MSKMSQLHAELSDQAAELGFESYEEALAKGYVIDYLQGKLVKQDEQESAHEAWLEERDALLKDLREQEQMARESYEVDHTVIKHAIDFIEKGEM